MGFFDKLIKKKDAGAGSSNLEVPKPISSSVPSFGDNQESDIPKFPSNDFPDIKAGVGQPDMDLPDIDTVNNVNSQPVAPQDVPKASDFPDFDKVYEKEVNNANQQHPSEEPPMPPPISEEDNPFNEEVPEPDVAEEIPEEQEEEQVQAQEAPVQSEQVPDYSSETMEAPEYHPIHEHHQTLIKRNPSSIKGPLFIDTEVYKDIIGGVNVVKNRVSNCKDIITKLNENKIDADLQYKKWKDTITSLRRNLDACDKILFER